MSLRVNSAMESESKLSQRLPDTVFPTHYDLEVIPDLSHEHYKGRVLITVDVRKSTDTIIVNGADLKLNQVSLKHGEKVHAPVKIEQNKKANQSVFVFGSPFPIGISQLEIDFENILLKNMKGLYRTSYYDDNKRLHECLVTNFEPDDASRAFPCFDEPAFKATFKLNIKYSHNKTVISNTPIEKIEDLGQGFSNYCFKVTPKMSTYLLAFAVGDFGCISKKGSSGITFSCYAPINKVHQLEYSLHACEAFIDFYSDFFKVPYPLEKLDLIALPDISVGAMENWGLVTFREDLLLVDPKLTSSSTKKDVSLVVAHELAHQWFGNLVTMDWWTDLWLNEGFANWIEYLAVDTVFPGLTVWKSYLISNYFSALEADSYFYSHPVEIEATHPSDLDDIFDHITYCKGASVINMMSHFVGLNLLQKGLHDYMVKYKYSNVSTQNLWDCLEHVSQKPVSKLIGTFTIQTGYPIVHVTADSGIATSKSAWVLKLSQNRFLLDSKREVPRQLWLIPVNVSSVFQKESKDYDFMLDQESSQLNLKEGEGLKYILLNKKRSAFYRVHYGEPLYSLLFTHLSELLMEDRLGLLGDYFSFARSGIVGTDHLLDLVAKFSEIGEQDEEIWRGIIRALNDIYCLMYYSSEFESFNKYFGVFCIKIMGPILTKYKITPDKHEYSESTMHLLSSLMSALLHYDHDLRKKLLFWFDEYVAGRLNLLPDLRSCVFRACYTSEGYFQKLMKYFQSVKMTEEKVDILVASSAATNKSIISQLYDFSLSPGVRPQDGRFVYRALCNTPHSHTVGWEFVKKEFEKIKELYYVPFIITRVLCSVISGFVSMEKYHECLEYFKSHQSIEINPTLNQALENIKIRNSWFVRDEKAILKWLERVS